MIPFQLYYGEEQEFYLYDNGASNYMFGYVLFPFDLSGSLHCIFLGVKL